MCLCVCGWMELSFRSSFLFVIYLFCERNNDHCASSGNEQNKMEKQHFSIVCRMSLLLSLRVVDLSE